MVPRPNIPKSPSRQTTDSAALSSLSLASPPGERQGREPNWFGSGSNVFVEVDVTIGSDSDSMRPDVPEDVRLEARDTHSLKASRTNARSAAKWSSLSRRLRLRMLRVRFAAVCCGFSKRRGSRTASRDSLPGDSKIRLNRKFTAEFFGTSKIGLALLAIDGDVAITRAVQRSQVERRGAVP
jgi:hypothetical protein